MENASAYEQWFLQSDYDMEVAGDMFKGKRNIYCIFMCHLSLEKALKGLLVKLTNEFPGKTHNLITLVGKLSFQMNDSDIEFVEFLSNLSVPTRYPEDLMKMIKAFSNERTQKILMQTEKLQHWIKNQ